MAKAKDQQNSSSLSVSVGAGIMFYCLVDKVTLFGSIVWDGISSTRDATNSFPLDNILMTSYLSFVFQYLLSSMISPA